MTVAPMTCRGADGETARCGGIDSRGLFPVVTASAATRARSRLRCESCKPGACARPIDWVFSATVKSESRVDGLEKRNTEKVLTVQSEVRRDICL